MSCPRCAAIDAREPAPSPEPPREEAGGWKRTDHIDPDGDYVMWRAPWGHAIDVPLAVEAAIRAPLEAEVARLRGQVEAADALADSWLRATWGPYNNPGVALRRALGTEA